MARAFHATRLEWSYTEDPEFIRRAKDQGLTVVSALSPSLPDTARGRSYQKGRLVDLNGHPATAPWMSLFPNRPYWGCANSEEYLRIFVNAARRALAAGADSLHMDDSDMNGSASHWGACYCAQCVREFRKHLSRSMGERRWSSLGLGQLPVFDYRQFLREQADQTGNSAKRDLNLVKGALRSQFVEFQRKSSLRFVAVARRLIDESAGCRVAMSSNNCNGRLVESDRLFDYGVAELSEKYADPVALHGILLNAARNGRRQVLTMPKRHQGTGPLKVDVPLLRRVIAYVYANGGLALAPWDVFLPGPESHLRRFFGRASDFDDLYRFVREKAHLLDGYEEAFATGGEPSIRRAIEGPWEHRGVPMQGFTPDLYAFMRVNLGQRGMPVVVHIVNWGRVPSSSTIFVSPMLLGRARRIRLHRPGLEPVWLDVRSDGHLRLPELREWAILELPFVPIR